MTVKTAAEVPSDVQKRCSLVHYGMSLSKHNGVEAFLYCQIEGAVSDETVILACQQSTDLFFLVR